MDEEERTEESGAAAPRSPGARAIERWREGKRAVNVWLPEELVKRIHSARRAQRRSLTVFVELALENVVELAERYGPAHRKRQGRGG